MIEKLGIKKMARVTSHADGTITRSTVSYHLTRQGAEKARLRYAVAHGFDIYIDGKKAST